ncbi:hypothetical protein HZU40_20170 [Mycolicibacterium fluoranthenivorans]|uniref:Uncharacterized protein n=1 Tax=Mycolicibacterium fluoranthenivorans TaxID=258505 RepID=A0A7G8P8A8_9MYCO|nr:hypothetical protein [Mycolicibacterium fluoranthenivorans]QNJ90574.1 hypothetical protein HZU40_20170 [Mycolicibacterium fluoranthenivorans]
MSSGLLVSVIFGASTDVVLHETGRAILDALPQDQWSVNVLEDLLGNAATRFAEPGEALRYA